MKIIRTRRGARIVHGTSVLSETLAAPGPTDSVFDVLAAVASLAAPDAHVAMLGFASGGMIAPLRALGSRARVRAVDLDTRGVALFDELCGAWAGDVRIDEADAAVWLARQRRRFDVIIEDLSIELPDDVGKPEVSYRRLPGLIHSRLGRRGLAVVNVLPMAGLSWRGVTHALLHPWAGRGSQVIFREYVNRFVIVGHDVPSAARLSAALKGRLRGIGSRMAEKFSVRALPR